MNAADILAKAAETFRERNKLYGNNYHRFGKLCLALFPDGLSLRTEDDFNRFGVLVQILSKQTRYAEQFAKGGHIDSIHDTIVYSAMLEELDQKKTEETVDAPFVTSPEQAARIANDDLEEKRKLNHLLDRLCRLAHQAFLQLMAGSEFVEVRAYREACWKVIHQFSKLSWEEEMVAFRDALIAEMSFGPIEQLRFVDKRHPNATSIECAVEP